MLPPLQPGRLRPRLVGKQPPLQQPPSPNEPAEKRDQDERSPQELPESKVARTLNALDV